MHLVNDYLAKLKYHVPVSKLVPIGSALKEIKANHIDYDASLLNYHLFDVFELLADLNAEAQFVLAKIPKLDVKTFCNFYKPYNLNKIRALFDQASLGLLNIIQFYNINYVNISWAPSRERIFFNMNKCVKQRLHL